MGVIGKCGPISSKSSHKELEIFEYIWLEIGTKSEYGILSKGCNLNTENSEY